MSLTASSQLCLPTLKSWRDSAHLATLSSSSIRGYTMNIYRAAVIATASAVIGSGVLASELYHPAASAEEGMTLHLDHRKGSLTRAEVEASVMQAQRDGTLTWISRGYPPRYPFAQGPALTRTRADVDAELRAWKMRPPADGLYLVPGEAGWVDVRQVR
jgi:hypothetical protein